MRASTTKIVFKINDKTFQHKKEIADHYNISICRATAWVKKGKTDSGDMIKQITEISSDNKPLPFF